MASAEMIATVAVDGIRITEKSSTLPPLQISKREILVLVTVCYAAYLATLVLLGGSYQRMASSFGDNQPYVAIATAIRQWDFSQIKPKQFWGFPYAIAVSSRLTGMSELSALLVLSLLCSFATILCAYKLWGGWIAAIFAVASREWFERSLLGGAEPVFLALLFGAFIAARQKQWLFASVMASLCTIVRPTGVFALGGIGIALLIQRDYRKLAVATFISLTIGALYVLPLALYLGNPLANVKGYGAADWNSHSPVAVPLMAIVRSAATGEATNLNLARTGTWMVFVLVSASAMCLVNEFRSNAKRFPVEALFCALYVLLLFTYNSDWGRAEFPRFAIPVIPFCVLAIKPWIPQNRYLLWVFGITSALLSSAETTGIMHVIAMIRRVL